MNKMSSEQYLVIHWDWTKTSVLPLTGETIEAYKLLFNPNCIFFDDYGTGFMMERDGKSATGPRTEIITYAEYQSRLRQGIEANDNAAKEATKKELVTAGE
jgi:hypothetical protein